MKQILKYLIFIMIGIIIYSYINIYDTFSIGIPDQRYGTQNIEITVDVGFRPARSLEENTIAPPPTAEEGIPLCEPEPEPESEYATTLPLHETVQDLLLIRTGDTVVRQCRFETYPIYRPMRNEILLIPSNVATINIGRITFNLPLRERYTNVEEFLQLMTLQQNNRLVITDTNEYNPNTLGILYNYGNDIYNLLTDTLNTLRLDLYIMDQIFAFLVPNITEYRTRMDDRTMIPEAYPTRVITTHTDADIDIIIDRIIRILYYLNAGFDRLVVVNNITRTRLDGVEETIDIGHMIFLHNRFTGQVVHLFHINIAGVGIIRNLPPAREQIHMQHVFINIFLPGQNHEIERRIRESMTRYYMGTNNIHLGTPTLGQLAGRAAQRGARPGLLCAARYALGL
jgi:hypothetical protein